MIWCTYFIFLCGASAKFQQNLFSPAASEGIPLIRRKT